MNYRTLPKNVTTKTQEVTRNNNNKNRYELVLNNMLQKDLPLPPH